MQGERYLTPSFRLNDGQCLPVDSYTAMDGSRFDFTPNIVQERGNAGSQVILK